MEPDPNASAQQQQAREQARAAARAAAIQSCHIECRNLLHKILHLQNELFRLQINQNPNDVERRQIKDLIHQIVRLKLIMNLFHFCILCIKKPKRFDTHIFTFEEPYPDIDETYVRTQTLHNFLYFDLRDFFIIMKETLDQVFNDFDVFNYIHDKELRDIENGGMLGAYLHQILRFSGEYDEQNSPSIMSYVRSILLAAFENTERYYENYQTGMFRRFNLTIRKWLLQLCVNITKTTHSWISERGGRYIFLSTLQSNSRTCQALVPKMPGRTGLFYFVNFKNYKERIPLEEGDKRTRGEITSIINSLYLLLYIINIQYIMGYDGGKPPMEQLLKALNFLCSQEYPLQITQIERQGNRNPEEVLQKIREDIKGIANEVGKLDFQLSSEAARAAAEGPGLGPFIEDVVPRLNTNYLNRIADYKPLSSPSIESQIISFLRSYDAHNLYQTVTANALIPMLIQEHVTKHALALDGALGDILVQLFAATGRSPETRADDLITMLADRLKAEQDPKIKTKIQNLIVFLNEYKQQQQQQQQLQQQQRLQHQQQRLQQQQQQRLQQEQRLQQQQQQRLQQQQQQQDQEQQQQQQPEGGRRKSISRIKKVKSKSKIAKKTNKTIKKKSRSRRRHLNKK
jgi:hypothetical protein